MSLTGHYLRVTVFELRRAIKDPDWALHYALDVIESEDESKPSTEDARYCSTYKSWAILGFLMQRIEFPVDAIGGEETIPDVEEWGPAPPGYLSAERVNVAATAFGRTTYDELIRGVDPAELDRAEVYSWDPANDGTFEWARAYYDDLAAFFGAAADGGDAMLIWVN